MGIRNSDKAVDKWKVADTLKHNKQFTEENAD